MNNSNADVRVCQPSQLRPFLTPGGRPKSFLKRSAFAALASVFAALMVLSGCKSSGGLAITVQITPDSASVDGGQTLDFTANLANDLRGQGVTWSLSGSNCAGLTGAGTSGCGNLSAVTTHSVTYTAPSGLSSSLSVTLTATAVANTTSTKTAAITVEQPLTFSITNPACGSAAGSEIPCASNGIPYSTGIPVTGGVAPLKFTLAPGSGSLPAGLTMNESGAITGRPSGPVSGQPNPATFTVQVTDSSTTPTSATQSYSIYVSPAPTLVITALSPLTAGYPNYPYSTSVSTTGGVRPFTFSLASGSLPPGLSLNTNNGVISGTPTTASGTPSTFTIRVTDSTLPTAQTVTSSSLAISIQNPQPLSISPSSLPNGQTAAPYSAQLSASGGIPNPTTGGYTWAITSGQLPPGLTFNTATGQITGTPILVATSTFTVQVSDSQPTPATLSAEYSITIAAGTSNDSLITGEYSFLFQGFDSDGTVVLGGSLVTDGNGKITSGALDSNRGSGVIGGFVAGTVPRASLSGTYSVGTDGRGKMELTAATALPALTLTLDFDLVLDSNGNVHFFEDNSTTTNTDLKKTHGIGIMKPVGGSFASGSFNGNYAFLFNGVNSSGAPTALGGVVHADGTGNIGTAGSGANGDYNEAGTFSSAINVTGTFSFDSGTHGDAQLTFDLPGKSPYTLTFSFDFVSANDIFFADVDPTDATHPRLSGEMLLQSPTAPYNAAAFSGPSVATGTGLSSKSASVFAGVLAPVPTTTANCAAGVANCVTLNYDENNAGTVDSPSLIGNFQISSNGRVTFTFNQLSGTQLTAVPAPRLAVAYLYGAGQGFIMGADSSVTTGLLEQQETGVTFSDASIDDNYTLSTAFPAENQVPNLIGETTASGTGTLLGTIDEVTPPPASNLTQSVTPNLDQSLVGTYGNVSATGRATMTTNSPIGVPTNLVLYIVSPGSFRAISTDPGDANPQVFLFDH
jgi:Putative Ig domain